MFPTLLGMFFSNVILDQSRIILISFLCLRVYFYNDAASAAEAESNVILGLQLAIVHFAVFVAIVVVRVAVASEFIPGGWVTYSFGGVVPLIFWPLTITHLRDGRGSESVTKNV